MKVILKAGKEKSLLRGHPWIFSGAIESLPAISPGDLLPVHSSNGQFLAQAYFHPENSLSGRVLSFSNEPIIQVVHAKIARAVRMRQQLPIDSNAIRLINAEGDGLPGLIVDAYDGILVMQVNTWGIEKLKTQIIDALVEIVKPQAIYEKSLSASRRQEGLNDFQGWVWNKGPAEIVIQESGIAIHVSIEEGQKTGFFLDQREMRKQVGRYAQGKKVLNCFSYSGGFSLHALEGGARQVTSVDSCPRATALARKNGLADVVCADVFDYLQTDWQADFVILDPPAFAKKRADSDAACQGYKHLNRKVFEKMPPQSFVLTCSCSYYIDETLFQNLIFQAASEAKREVQIISRHLQAADHPVSLNHPEGAYLKSLLLFIA